MAKSTALNLNQSYSAYYRWLQTGFIALVIVLLLTGCAPDPEGKSGAGDTSISGLEMATTMSVVAPVNNRTTRARQKPSLTRAKDLLNRYITTQSFSPESDYVQDKVSVSVDDETGDILEGLNMILCFLDQAAMGDMVNRGPYVAYLNPGACLAGADDFGNFRVVAESVRAFEHSPQYVSMWVPFSDFLGNTVSGGFILQLIVFDEPSDAYPYGRFELKMGLEVSSTDPSFDLGASNALMNIRTIDRDDGKIEFFMISESGDRLVQNYDSYDLSSVDVVLDDVSGASGASKTFDREIKIVCKAADGTIIYEGDPTPCTDELQLTQSGYEIVVSPEYFYRRRTGLINNSEACYDRANPFLDINYNLYYEQGGVINGKTVTAGQRVELFTGLGFEYQNEFGWMSQWGLNWYGDGLIPDGATIQSDDYVEGQTSSLVVHASEGEMTRDVGKSLLISDLVGVQLIADYGDSANYPGVPAAIGAGIVWDTFGRGPGNFTVGGVAFDDWVVELNPVSLDFEVTAGRTNTAAGWPPVYVYTPVTPAVINEPVGSAGTISGARLQVRLGDYGQRYYYDHDATLAIADRVATYKDRGGDVAPWHRDIYTVATDTGSQTTLYCYYNCPIGGMFAPLAADALYYPSFGTAIGSVGSITQAINLIPTEGGLRTYDFRTTGRKYELIDNTNGQPVALRDVSGIVSSSVNGGPLRDTALPLADMYHSALNPTGTTQSGDADTLAVGEINYDWRTGPEEYQRAYVLTEGTASGPVLVFDDDLRFNYVHSLLEDANDVLDIPEVEAQDGLPSSLYYDNYLGGFPYFEWPYVSTSATYKPSVSAVNPVDGVVLTDENGDSYVLKAKYVYQYFKEFVDAGGVPDVSGCLANLDLTKTDSLVLPSLEDLYSLSITFGDLPISVDTPAAVIEGEVK
ncbi:MAG: hypothetical protein BMS9Abin36_1309 [Gammaproteobacteria bacterium]|nr:MAG: hypothetical protein BMS9Abin36_1309 [Gammaproteobacteria bacterium]